MQRSFSGWAPPLPPGRRRSRPQTPSRRTARTTGVLHPRRRRHRRSRLMPVRPKEGRRNGERDDRSAAVRPPTVGPTGCGRTLRSGHRERAAWCGPGDDPLRQALGVPVPSDLPGGHGLDGGRHGDPAGRPPWALAGRGGQRVRGADALRRHAPPSGHHRRPPTPLLHDPVGVDPAHRRRRLCRAGAVDRLRGPPDPVGLPAGQGGLRPENRGGGRRLRVRRPVRGVVLAGSPDVRAVDGVRRPGRLGTAPHPPPRRVVPVGRLHARQHRHDRHPVLRDLAAPHPAADLRRCHRRPVAAQGAARCPPLAVVVLRGPHRRSPGPGRHADAPAVLRQPGHRTGIRRDRRRRHGQPQHLLGDHQFRLHGHRLPLDGSDVGRDLTVALRHARCPGAARPPGQAGHLPARDHGAGAGGRDVHPGRVQREPR